ncbi:MAG: YciI-like protein [Blastocatellia bacterium]|nr:YciI-like protein [Blastocatellia bacterium]MCS7158504.1 YciI-like protein [Blastocatellia bacterium]MDW8167817.1 YciI-like protein [Acidobacteriota bacterium]MDW8257547.1 YciI-like protein [Acidobacteriota bacterium]
MYIALLYDPVEDYLQRRAPFRAEHLALIEQWHRDGRLLMAGAFEPADGALFVFRVNDPAEVEAFIHSDPYVRNGLIRSWRVRKWNVVVGGE